MKHQRKERQRQHQLPAGPFDRFSPWVQDLLCVALLYLITLILFRGIIFENAAFASEGDTAAALSYAHAGNRLAEAERADVLWMPYFFAGMPTFGNVAFLPHNVSYLQTAAQSVLNVLYLNGKWTWLVVYCLIGGVGMFFLCRSWHFSRAASLLAAVMVMISPYTVGLAGEGHGSKLMALSYLPLTVLLTSNLFQRRDALSFGLLVVGIGTLMLTNHMQIVYYALMILGGYLLFDVLQDVKGNPLLALRKTLLFTGALIVGFAISSYIYLSVYEYAQYSMRGGGTTGTGGGLAFDYATNWSWHPGELFTLLVPGFYGMKADLYWGPMIPWTNTSVYVGVAGVFFAVAALAYRRTRLVLFFGITTIVLIMLSWGNNLPVVYEFLFRTLPFFNKFRAPSQLLHLLPFTMGVLAAAGFSAIMDAKEEKSRIDSGKLVRALAILAGISGVALLVALAAKSGMYDFLSGSMFLKDGELEQFRQRYGAQASQAAAQIKGMRFDVFWKDAVKFFLLAVMLCGLVIGWLRGRLSAWIFAAGTLLLVIVDLSLVSSKYIDPKPAAALEQSFAPDATIRFLQQQPGLFRVFPLGGQLFMDNSFAYHGLQSVGGYSPAKLRIYQTMLDSTMYRGANPQFPLNMAVVNMLNVEYLVVPGALPEGLFPLVFSDPARRIMTYRNPAALPRTFFVDTVITALTDAATFSVLNDPAFLPARAATLYASLPEPVGPADSSRKPVITAYSSREIRIACETPRQALLVLGEIYYPAGWKAFVDGRETPIHRTDYLLRSVVVPPGKHEVLFSFDPPVYRTGWLLSNGAWAVGLLCMLIGVWRSPWMRRKTGKAERAASPQLG
jgi:hypothetical protein